MSFQQWSETKVTGATGGGVTVGSVTWMTLGWREETKTAAGALATDLPGATRSAEVEEEPLPPPPDRLEL